MGVSLYDQAQTRSRNAGIGAEDEFYRRAMNADPRKALAETAGGLFDQFERGVGRKISNLRGSMVGSGRLEGGYGELDEAETVYDARADLNSKIAGLSLDAEGMSMANTNAIGQFGQNQTGQYLDLLTGGMDRAMAEREGKRNRKASLWGSLAGLAGMVAGGPIGGAIGGWAGKKLAGAN